MGTTNRTVLVIVTLELLLLVLNPKLLSRHRLRSVALDFRARIHIVTTVTSQYVDGHLTVLSVELAGFPAVIFLVFYS